MPEETQIPDELSELKAKNEEYLNGWKRERADFINYKKQESERSSEMMTYVNRALLLRMLPLLDHILLAEKQLPEKLKEGSEGTPQSIEWTKGFLAIKKQFESFLKEQGVEEIPTAGKAFDPNLMESVEESEGQETSGTVIEELQKGYTMQGKLIRPAKVKISK